MMMTMFTDRNDVRVCESVCVRDVTDLSPG